jgi:hypothetical protein
MTTTATPAQIAYATKLQDDMAAYAAMPITDATRFGLERSNWQILGYTSREDYLTDADRRTCTPDEITADAQARAEQLRARQAELAAADIHSMSKTEISAYIAAAKKL